MCWYELPDCVVGSVWGWPDGSQCDRFFLKYIAESLVGKPNNVDYSDKDRIRFLITNDFTLLWLQRLCLIFESLLVIREMFQWQFVVNINVLSDTDNVVLKGILLLTPSFNNHAISVYTKYHFLGQQSWATTELWRKEFNYSLEDIVDTIARHFLLTTKGL